MLLSALEINDTGLTLLSPGAEPVVSPGVAVLDNRELLLGEAAARQFRLRPGNTNSQFWEQLNLDPLASTTREIRSSADLVYSHLKSIWNPGPGEHEVILVVPGVYSPQQLALLLGITNECGIPVRGVVDTAVAASRYSSPGRRLLHLDVHLHRMVISELEEGPLIRRQRSDSIAGVGLTQLADLWCNRIADAFVRNTRFDPMHQAESEQLLYDSLPGWLERMEQDGSALLEVESRGRRYQLSFKRHQLVEASQDLFRQIAEQVNARRNDAGVLVQLTHTARALPGLAEALAELDNCQVVTLEAHSGALGAMQHADQIRCDQDNLRYVTSLPWHPQDIGEASLASGAKDSLPTARQKPLATHIILDGIAYLPTPCLGLTSNSDGEHVLVQRDRDDTTRPHIHASASGLLLSDGHSWMINGKPAEPGQALRSGDQVTANGSKQVMLAISLDKKYG
ncbi:MAG: hypothetical protein OEM03_09875 [Chromatiales bacterium]|nr:hypothetical protein [Chromatiales bacterium]